MLPTLVTCTTHYIEDRTLQHLQLDMYIYNSTTFTARHVHLLGTFTCTIQRSLIEVSRLDSRLSVFVIIFVRILYQGSLIYFPFTSGYDFVCLPTQRTVSMQMLPNSAVHMRTRSIFLYSAKISAIRLSITES